MQAVSGFKPLNLGISIDCSTTVPTAGRMTVLAFHPSVTAAAGFKPLNLGISIDCSITVLPLLAVITFHYFVSSSQQWLDLNR